MSGRTIKLTEDRKRQIVDLIEAGNYASTAAGAAGIGERTFWRWFKRGSEIDSKIEDYEDRVEVLNEQNWRDRATRGLLTPPSLELPTENDYICWQFWQEVKKAQDQAEVNAVETIQKAAEKSWQAAAWWLERTKKDKFSKVDKLEHGGSVQHQHLLDVSEAEIEAVNNRLAAVTAEDEDEDFTKLLEGNVEENPYAEEEVIDVEVEEMD